MIESLPLASPTASLKADSSHAAFLRKLVEDLWISDFIDEANYERVKKIADLIDDPCIDKREDGEPMFVLLGRDSAAPDTMACWYFERLAEINKGLRPDNTEERNHIATIREKAKAFREWRKANR
jgi:hypothetical protein